MLCLFQCFKILFNCCQVQKQVVCYHVPYIRTKNFPFTLHTNLTGLFICIVFLENLLSMKQCGESQVTMEMPWYEPNRSSEHTQVSRLELSKSQIEGQGINPKIVPHIIVGQSHFTNLMATGMFWYFILGSPGWWACVMHVMSILPSSIL